MWKYKDYMMLTTRYILCWVVVELGTLILEPSVFQQSPRLLLLQLGLADRHEVEAGLRHHLADRAVPLLAGVDIVLPGRACQFTEISRY